MQDFWNHSSSNQQSNQAGQGIAGENSSVVETSPTQRVQKIVFIDSTVENYQSLAAGVEPGTEVFILNPMQDGVAQIAQVLAGRTDIASVHIVSHGTQGSLQLGSTQLNSSNLEAYTSQLQQWANALTPDADILLYGCNVALGISGVTFVEKLSQLTGANIAASNNLTGSAALGGDWNLEVKTGSITTSLAFDSSVLQEYTSVLEIFKFIGQSTFNSNYNYSGTTVGGLSGITYNAATNTYYAISDAKNDANGPVRFYTLNIDLSSGSLGTINFTGVTTLKDSGGTPFAANISDTEGIALTSGGNAFISSEGIFSTNAQPFINRFNLTTGNQNLSLPVPSPKFDISAYTTQGVRDNKAFESLTITPDQQVLFTATEVALEQDGSAPTSTAGSPSRILRYDLSTGSANGEFLYNTDADNGISELLALDQNTLLAIDRNVSLGVGKLYQVSLQGATNIQDNNGLLASGLSGITAVQKTFLSNFPLGTNFEGMTLGATLPNGKRSLVLVSDNNFGANFGIPTQFAAFEINSAPVLDNSGLPILTTINEDPTSNPGTLISSLIGTSVTDLDTGDAKGIAVTGVDKTNGTWEFSINGGSSWAPFTPSESAAQLLAANADTRIRFVPSLNYNGTVTAGITFRAWDQTTGTNGGTADITTSGTGGLSSFSTAIETASITINPVNDAPTFTPGSNQIVTAGAGAQSVTAWVTGFNPGPTNESSQTLLGYQIVSNSAPSLFKVAPTINAAGNLIYTPSTSLGSSATATIDVTVQDNGGTANGGADTSAIKFFNITVNPNIAPLNVVINEVAWMGTNADFNDEWIELYNPTAKNIDLSGWTLTSGDGTPSITFPAGKIIPAGGYFLLERTDNTTVNSIPSDLIYTGSLGNASGETLTLKTPDGVVIDTANGNGGAWPAGANVTGTPTVRLTMERTNPLAADTDNNWHRNDGVTYNGIDVGGNPIYGTPKAANSVPVPAGVTVTPITNVTTEAGGTATFTVKLNTIPTANVTIGLTSSDTTEGILSTSSLFFTPSNWNTPQTVTITGVDDTIVDGNIAYSIITAATVSTDSNYNNINPADVAVVNNDNDTPIVINITAIDADAAEAGANTGTYQITRTGNTTGNLTVKFAVSNNSASSGDYTLTDSNGNAIAISNGIASVTLLAGQTSFNITLTAVDDIQAEAAETLKLDLVADAAYAIASSQNTATAIQQNDTVVINTNDSGEGSLRQAIINANAFSGTDTIGFQIGTGLQTITPLSALPTLTGSVIIDGTTQTGFSGTPIIQLSGSGTGTGLKITAGNSTVRGLIFNGFQDGVELSGGGNNVIAGNFIGTNAAGNAVAGNSRWGVFINGSSNNIIGGTTAGTRNIISGNSVGLFVTDSGNQIQGNYIGTDVTGNVDLGNTADGISIQGTNNIIGGTTTGARNVISGNNQNGVSISQVGSTGNQVLGNYIGTNATGTADLGNTQNGVEIQYAPNNIIGGATAGAGNVISGNNNNGIWITGNTATGTQVLGNYIGTNASGKVAIGNSLRGITVSAPDNTIGGTAAGAGNVISGNVEGIAIQGTEATGNQIQGNYIGTQADGTSALGNTSHGVVVRSDAKNNTIGGTTAGAGNTIAFNNGDGVFVDTNFGTVINNGILANAIFSNSGLGIDLGTNGVTANDVGDGDAGANNLQNFPLLTSAVLNGANTTVTGTFNSNPNATFRLEFFSNTALDPSGNGEGKTLLGFTNVTTDASGNGSFTANLATMVALGNFITATATNSNNTSEFSTGIPVTTLVSISAIDATAAESGTDTGIYQITRTGTTGDLTVNLAVDGSSTASGNDYTLSSKGLSVVIPDGKSFVNVTLTAVDDTLPELAETLRLNLATGAGYTIDTAKNNATVAIASNDTIQYAITTASLALKEGDTGKQTVTFTVTRSGGIGVASTVDYGIGGTATNGIDYNNILVTGGTTALSGTLSFGVGETTKTINLDVLGDTIFEQDETINVTLSKPNLTLAPASSTITTGTAQVTVINDDAKPTVSITPATVTQSEGTTGTSAYTFTVSLSNPSDQPITVNYSTNDGTATTTDGDYTDNDGILTFNPGDPLTKTITVNATGDNKFEKDETFSVKLNSATNANLGNTTATGIIKNDDTPGFTISPISGNTTEAGGTATFTVKLNSQPTANVTLGLTSSDTTEGTVSSPSLTFTANNWNIAQTVTVKGVDDALVDGNIAYNIITAPAVSTDANYNQLNPGDVAVTNIDNDAAGFTITPISGNTTEAGGTANFTVKLNSQPTSNVTIGLASSDPTEGSVSSPSLTFTSNNWNIAQTITVKGIDDVLVDGNIAYNIVTSAAISTDAKYNGLHPQDVAVVNIDNDTAPLNVINGTWLSETLVGTSLDDRINGFGGHDTIVGGLGKDRIYGDDGNDTLIGDLNNN
ncbi:esterase-like activity of phytase family protein, partial [Coleofasciculus sp. FACHB-SPT36]|uniref:esterase-like activity of phytase family protein n=1 Tax=Coleofasciculus sp. FACHB-SPT36 TaxID=2692790 RepID=UPI00168BFACC